MKITELNIEVEDASEFEDEAEEILTAFCNDLEADGMTEPIPEDKKWLAEEEGVGFLWSEKASIFIDQKIAELYRIGNKYFPAEDFDIKSHMYKEL